MDGRIIGMDSVRCHPDNPNMGDVESIIDSLQVNGQFRPIVVQKSTGYIIKGNHTYQAMRRLGWAECQAVLVDCDDTKAKRILLSDNAASDKAYTDMSAVMDIMATLPDTRGTGYGPEDLRMPDMGLDAVPPLLEPDDEPEVDRSPPAEKLPEIAIGRAKAALQPDSYTEWRRLMPRRKSEAAERLTELLGVSAAPAPGSSQNILGSMDQVELSALTPYPGNPQQGDTGLVTQLLEEHGQYSPVVADRRTGYILGGHTLCRAAKALGWTTVGVNWVDVDADAAKRILLVDNSLASRRSYDHETMGRLLAELGSVQGTGLDLEDVQTILEGRDVKPVEQRGKAVKVKVGTVSTTLTYEQYREMDLTPGEELYQLADLIGMNRNAIRF